MFNLLKKYIEIIFILKYMKENSKNYMVANIDEPVTSSAELSTSRCLQVTKTPPNSPCRNTTSIFVAA